MKQFLEAIDNLLTSVGYPTAQEMELRAYTPALRAYTPAANLWGREETSAEVMQGMADIIQSQFFNSTPHMPYRQFRNRLIRDWTAV